MEAALQPQSEPGMGEPAPSILTHEPMPRKGSSRDPRHHHGSVHRTQTSVRHWSQSLVPHKKKRSDRGHSLTRSKDQAVGKPPSSAQPLRLTSTPAPAGGPVESGPSSLASPPPRRPAAPLHAGGIRGCIGPSGTYGTSLSSKAGEVAGTGSGTSAIHRQAGNDGDACIIPSASLPGTGHPRGGAAPVPQFAAPIRVGGLGVVSRVVLQ